MKQESVIVVLGTLDSKGEEHQFIKETIEKIGFKTLTINVGTKGPSIVSAGIDLYNAMRADGLLPASSRDVAIELMVKKGRETIRSLYERGSIGAIISAGGGSGTHLCTSVMKVLPLNVPKVMISTVASRNMSEIVGTKNITMMHSVVDLLGVNSISGVILEQAAAAVCAMVSCCWSTPEKKPRIALSFFGFITLAAEIIRNKLTEKGYEVIAFHANGTGGMAMEELAANGYFAGILDLATHELADALKNGYCGGIGPERFQPPTGTPIPRLVVPGGLDCAVLEFTRQNIPEAYQNRKIFFYDFRSAIRLSPEESRVVAAQLAEKLNADPARVKVLVPLNGWSVADKVGAPLYDPKISRAFIDKLRADLNPCIEFRELACHINDPEFGDKAAQMMDDMIKFGIK